MKGKKQRLQTSFVQLVIYILFNFTFFHISVQQLREQGFRHIDALDPSESMLSVAKKENLYDNYIVEFLTDKQLPIPAGQWHSQLYDNSYDTNSLLIIDHY